MNIHVLPGCWPAIFHHMLVIPLKEGFSHFMDSRPSLIRQALQKSPCSHLLCCQCLLSPARLSELRGQAAPQVSAKCCVTAWLQVSGLRSGLASPSLSRKQWWTAPPVQAVILCPDSAPLLMLTEAFLRTAVSPEQRTIVSSNDTEGLGFEVNTRHASAHG